VVKVVWTVLIVAIALISVPDIATRESVRGWALFWAGVWATGLLSPWFLARMARRREKTRTWAERK